MAQYLMSVFMVDGEPEPPADVIKQMYADVDEVNDEIKAAGKWVFGGGLEPADSATTVRPNGSDTVVTDGPFAESKEHLGGFWIIEAADLDEALAWSRKAAVACRGAVEVRPFQPEPA